MKTRLWMAAAAAALAALASFGAHAETRTPASWVPGDAAINPAVNDQSGAFVAGADGRVLVVWSDNRANSTSGYEGETSRDIYGLRFDASGAPMDAVPFPIAAGPASQEVPKIAWNGTNWLVVFESYDLGGTGYYQKSLAAVRVSPEGSVLDPQPIKIFSVTPLAGFWAVASDGNNWVVAIQGTSAGNDIVALRISPAGTVLDPGGRSLVPETYYLRSNFHLEAAGGIFLLTYDEMATGSSATSALRFDGNLIPLDPAPFPLLDQPISTLAANGSTFYAVWNQQLPDYSVAVMGTRIGTNGQKLDGAGVNISGPNQPQSYTTTAVAWDGMLWKVTWGSNNQVRLARVDPLGKVLDPGGVVLNVAQTGPTASPGNGSLEMVWTAYASGNNDLAGAHIAPDNTAGPSRPISTGAPWQGPGDAAPGASGYMLVYRSVTASQSRILAQPVNAAGVPTTAEPFVLDAGDSLNGPGSPAVAWNGSVYLVVWPNGNGVVARRLGPDGVPVDPAPFVVLNSSFGSVDVEALGDLFLVVGLRCGYTCQFVFPVAARVRGLDGVVLDPSPLSMGGAFCSSPRIAVLGGRWLLAWQANFSHDESLASTLGTFIDVNGVKVPDFTIHGYYSTAGGNGIFSLGLASSGSVALLVQSQELTSGVENDLLGRFIYPDGSVQPYFNLTPWAGNQYRPRVAWDGAQFVAVYQDQKARLAENSLEQLDARSDLFGMRITPSGQILDPQGFVFSNSPFGEAHPNAVSGGGTTLVLGSVMRLEAPFANYRLGYDLFGAGGNPWPVPAISANPLGGDVPLTVEFSSAGTADPNGSVASYFWDFGDGQTSTLSNPSHLFSEGGPFVVTLKVTDDAGAASLQEMLVKAVTPNQPPVAEASADRTSGQAPLDVTLYARGSYDPDGFIGNIRWTFSDDGSEYWGATAYHTFTQVGTWQVTLTTYDVHDATGSDTLTVTVSPQTPPPAPGNLTATAVSATQIDLAWIDNADNEQGFRIERCTGSAAVCGANPLLYSPIAEVGAGTTSYNDYSAAPKTTYTYRVRAFNASGNSGYSNTAQAATPSGIPLAPSNLTAKSGLNPQNRAYVNLRWRDNSADETGFVIERCRGAGCTNFTFLVQVVSDTTTYRDMAVARRTTYRYRVKARGVGGDSGYSNIATTTTP